MSGQKILHPPEVALMAIPLTDHDLECPHCHTMVKVETLVEASLGTARRTGGTTFGSTLKADVELVIKSVHISHTCDYSEDRAT